MLPINGFENGMALWHWEDNMKTLLRKAAPPAGTTW
jgi:hypothetical protein